jgi:hypothetical protein
MKDDRVDVKRTRSHSDTSSGSSGSHGRRRFPEKLVDKSRRIRALGTAEVDNGASITLGLANIVSLKACRLDTRLRNKRTGELSGPCYGQAGLIQAERLTESPPENPQKKQAVPDTDSGKPKAKAKSSSLRCSRFAVIPTTCIHNVENEEIEGDTWEFARADMMLINPESSTVEVNFEKAGYTPGPNEFVVLRQGDGNENTITWDYYDVTTAGKIDNRDSAMTLSIASFKKVERAGYQLQVGQKIGMAVYRNFEVEPEDAGLPKKSFSMEELRLVYGQEGRVNIYTGQITNVAPDGNAFEHDINTFRGCSGAIIFLLDMDQEGYGVDSSDYGKAIAVHVGGDRLANGTVTNLAFKIP